MQITNLELHMNYLFSAALKKCGNFQDAEDLTSEVLLAALNCPKEINDIRPWLSTVLNHKYYDMLRKKYKQPLVSINLVDETLLQYEPEITEVTYLVDCDVLRMEQDKPELAIPVITKEQCMKINEFFTPNIFAFADLQEPLLRDVLPKLKVSVPKHLENRIAEFRKYRHNQIPIAVIKEAIVHGDFDLKQSTPPMVLVIED